VAGCGMTVPADAESATGPLTGGDDEESSACAECLRRGALVGRLSPRIAGLLGGGRRRPTGLLELSDDDLVEAVGGQGAGDELDRFRREFDARRASKELTRAGLDCVCRHSSSYPGDLLRLSDPPAALYVAGGRGRLRALLAEPVVTIVGGRAATPYALEVAATLGRGLSAAGVTVVSGLALGVDAAAHRGAMKGGRGAIAVLASGADVPYPAAHRHLYETIRARAAIVSELPPGTAPMRWSFPARNRIMAALGQLTVVVEAQEASGSLITADFATQLGRDVGAVPGRVTGKRAAGSNGLLRDGARVIRGPEDVLDDLLGVGQVRARDRGRSRAGSGGRRDEAGAGDGDWTPDLRRRRKALAAAVREASSVVDLEPPARRVLAAVEAGEGVEAIGRSARLPAAEVRAALGRLELMGLVARDGLGAYERTGQGI